jgi:hypothetical protein
MSVQWLQEHDRLSTPKIPDDKAVSVLNDVGESVHLPIQVPLLQPFMISEAVTIYNPFNS